MNATSCYWHVHDTLYFTPVFVNNQNTPKCSLQGAKDLNFQVKISMVAVTVILEG